MTMDDIRSLDSILGQIRAIHDELAERHAGLAVLHMDAAMAALESHIRRQRDAADEQPSEQVA
ncbi:hypothetical protein ACFOMD_15600 [Sphingoaurantiacus capsulatus]|uniref:Uncharacterized protein n=1 Tax=Sphingoaurantiacus capsulatus TaxID=1771310 RepID=A0ABV7XDW2_9SPHN